MCQTFLVVTSLSLKSCLPMTMIKWSFKIQLTGINFLSLFNFVWEEDIVHLLRRDTQLCSAWSHFCSVFKTVIQMHQRRILNFPECFWVAVEMEINFRNYSKLTKLDCLSKFENGKIKIKICLVLTTEQTYIIIAFWKWITIY